MNLIEGIDRLQAIRSMKVGSDYQLVIQVFEPGKVGPAPTVAVGAICQGIDWNTGQVIIFPEEGSALTRLSAEEVADIRASVAKGTSWHAYKTFNALQKRIQALEKQLLLAGIIPAVAP